MIRSLSDLNKPEDTFLNISAYTRVRFDVTTEKRGMKAKNIIEEE